MLDIERSEVIGVVVETSATSSRRSPFRSRSRPGLAVARIGRSSVAYEIGIFGPGAAETAAHGHFVHVYVDRATRRPVPLPAPLLAFVEALR